MPETITTILDIQVERDELDDLRRKLQDLAALAKSIRVSPWPAGRPGVASGGVSVGGSAGGATWGNPPGGPVPTPPPSGQPEPPAPGWPQEDRRRRIPDWLRGFGVNERGSLGMALGYLARNIIHSVADAFTAQLYSGLATEAAGMVSGSPVSLVSGVLERETAQKRGLIRGISSAMGAGIAAGTTMLGGAMAVGSIGLAGGALGIGGLLLLQAGTSILTAKAEQEAEMVRAIRSRSVESMGESVGARMQQLENLMVLARAGRPYGEEHEDLLQRAAMMSRVSYGEMLRMMAGVAQAGGLIVNPLAMMALRYQYGITEAEIGQVARQARPGFGFQTTEGLSRPREAFGEIPRLVQQLADVAQSIGMPATLIPQVVQQMTSAVDRLASQGIQVAPESYARLLAHGAAAGLYGPVAASLPSRVMDFGEGVRRRLLGTVMPQESAVGLAELEAISRYGFFGAIEALEDPEKRMEILRGASRRLPGEIGRAFLQQALGGVSAATAEALSGYRLAEPELPEPGPGGWKQRIEEFFGRLLPEQEEALSSAAAAQTLRETAATWRQVVEYQNAARAGAEVILSLVEALASQEMRNAMERLHASVQKVIREGRR